MSLFSKLYRQSTAGTTLQISGLDGDRHGLYRINIFLLFEVPTTNSTIFMYPNGDSASLDHDTAATLGAPSAATTGQLIAHANDATNDVFVYGRLMLSAARTLDGQTSRRAWLFDGAYSIDATGAHNIYHSFGVYQDNTSNLTSLQLSSSSENIGVGSFVLVEQVTADNALL